MVKTKTKGKKIVTADTMEAMIREQYLPAKLQDALQTILDIEINAEWLATEDGRKVEGYTDDEAKQILKKQAEHKARLQKKVDIIKKAIDRKGYV